MGTALRIRARDQGRDDIYRDIPDALRELIERARTDGGLDGRRAEEFLAEGLRLGLAVTLEERRRRLAEESAELQALELGLLSDLEDAEAEAVAAEPVAVDTAADVGDWLMPKARLMTQRMLKIALVFMARSRWFMPFRKMAVFHQ